jgi:hypothetical protein
MINNKCKTIQSTIAPNPNEASRWIDLSADPYGSITKYWNGKEWRQSDDETEKIEALRSEMNKQFDTVSKTYQVKGNYITSVPKANAVSNVATDATLEQLIVSFNTLLTNLRSAGLLAA